MEWHKEEVSEISISLFINISTAMNNDIIISLFYEPPEFFIKVEDLAESEKGGVAICTGWNVKKIDVPNKTAYLEDDSKIKYEKCLIATGKYIFIRHGSQYCVYDQKNTKYCLIDRCIPKEYSCI